MKDKNRPEPAPEDRLLRMAMGFQQARVILTAVGLDVFTHLDKGPVGSESVARAVGCDPRAMDRLLSALCALSLCRKNQGLYLNAPEAEEFLVPGKPGFMAGLFHADHLYHSWGTLTEAVRKGTSVGLGPINDRGKDWLSAFIASMHWRASRHAPKVAEIVEVPKNGRVLDVGGGSGAYAAAFVKKGENVTAVVFDLPNVSGMTERYLAGMGVADKVTVVNGDYLTDPLPQGFSVVWLSAIIHSNSEEENIGLFSKCRAALAPGGRLVVQDFIMNADRTGPVFGAMFALNMLVNTENGDTYTRETVEGWMQQTGFAPEGRIDTSFGTSLVTGRAL